MCSPNTSSLTLRLYPLPDEAHTNIREYASWVFNGGYKHPATFIPIKEVQRTDADTTLLFLSGNGVLFTEPVEDDW